MCLSFLLCFLFLKSLFLLLKKKQKTKKKRNKEKKEQEKKIKKKEQEKKLFIFFLFFFFYFITNLSVIFLFEKITIFFVKGKKKGNNALPNILIFVEKRFAS